ncbi:MarR family winged helix-turn-helix transcriptional regulator [Erythrobacter sp. W53]|uniref:MarR family winged helix-turn-helix transcriptional regulator n=1 Tax=Erythrobacter sp. W53 TaxID=3425947 RepID=UPI003D769140
MTNLSTDPIDPKDAERLLASIGALLDRLLLQEPSEGGRPLRYNPLDYAVLRLIEKSDGCSGSDIARLLGIARTSVQSALERIDKAGLLEKRPDPAGGRIKTLHLTDKGAEMRAKIHAHDIVNMQALLSPLSAEERELMLPLLERVVSALSES